MNFLRTQRITGVFHAILALLVLVTITILSFFPVFFIGILKLFPNHWWRVKCTQAIDIIATLWVQIIAKYNDRFNPMQWHIDNLPQLPEQQWFLIISNHQSWLDILVLQRLFNKKIPVMKFFIKDTLKWVPLMGFAWWAMGCPFMKRYSKSYLEKNPHKKRRDLKATTKALKLFQSYPSTIINFVEGTRFSMSKKRLQQAPYQNLLAPKAGGISQVLQVLGQKIHTLIDVTIIYPNEKCSIWDFLCHRVRKVNVHIRHLTIPSRFFEQKLSSEELQIAFRNWLNDEWLNKDKLIGKLKG